HAGGLFRRCIPDRLFRTALPKSTEAFTSLRLVDFHLTNGAPRKFFGLVPGHFNDELIHAFQCLHCDEKHQIRRYLPRPGSNISFRIEKRELRPAGLQFSLEGLHQLVSYGTSHIYYLSPLTTVVRPSQHRTDLFVSTLSLPC